MTITKLTTLILAVSVALTGCTTIKDYMGKRSNGTLDYQNSQKLDPLALPAGQQTAEFTPLYPTPHVGENTLNLTNSAGRQYELPKPPQVR